MFSPISFDNFTEFEEKVEEEILCKGRGRNVERRVPRLPHAAFFIKKQIEDEELAAGKRKRGKGRASMFRPATLSTDAGMFRPRSPGEGDHWKPDVLKDSRLTTGEPDIHRDEQRMGSCGEMRWNSLDLKHCTPEGESYDLEMGINGALLANCDTNSDKTSSADLQLARELREKERQHHKVNFAEINRQMFSELASSVQDKSSFKPMKVMRLTRANLDKHVKDTEDVLRISESLSRSSGYSEDDEQVPIYERFGVTHEDIWLFRQNRFVMPQTVKNIVNERNKLAKKTENESSQVTDETKMMLSRTCDDTVQETVNIDLEHDKQVNYLKLLYDEDSWSNQKEVSSCFSENLEAENNSLIAISKDENDISYSSGCDAKNVERDVAMEIALDTISISNAVDSSNNVSLKSRDSISSNLSSNVDKNHAITNKEQSKDAEIPTESCDNSFHAAENETDITIKLEENCVNLEYESEINPYCNKLDMVCNDINKDIVCKDMNKDIVCKDMNITGQVESDTSTSKITSSISDLNDESIEIIDSDLSNSKDIPLKENQNIILYSQSSDGDTDKCLLIRENKVENKINDEKTISNGVEEKIKNKDQLAEATTEINCCDDEISSRTMKGNKKRGKIVKVSEDKSKNEDGFTSKAAEENKDINTKEIKSRYSSGENASKNGDKARRKKEVQNQKESFVIKPERNNDEGLKNGKKGKNQSQSESKESNKPKSPISSLDEFDIPESNENKTTAAVNGDLDKTLIEEDLEGFQVVKKKRIKRKSVSPPIESRKPDNTIWKLYGKNVIQADGLPLECDVSPLISLISSFGTIKDYQVRTIVDTCSVRFRLHDEDSCDYAVMCLDKSDIFPMVELIGPSDQKQPFKDAVDRIKTAFENARSSSNNTNGTDVDVDMSTHSEDMSDDFQQDLDDYDYEGNTDFGNYLDSRGSDQYDNAGDEPARDRSVQQEHEGEESPHYTDRVRDEDYNDGQANDGTQQKGQGDNVQDKSWNEEYKKKYAESKQDQSEGQSNDGVHSSGQENDHGKGSVQDEASSQKNEEDKSRSQQDHSNDEGQGDNVQDKSWNEEYKKKYAESKQDQSEGQNNDGVHSSGQENDHGKGSVQDEASSQKNEKDKSRSQQDHSNDEGQGDNVQDKSWNEEYKKKYAESKQDQSEGQSNDDDHSSGQENDHGKGSVQDEASSQKNEKDKSRSQQDHSNEEGADDAFRHAQQGHSQQQGQGHSLQQDQNKGQSQSQNKVKDSNQGQNQEHSPDQGRGQNQGQSNNQVRDQNQGQSINQGRGQNQEQSINQGRGQNQGQSNNQGRGQNQEQSINEGRGQNQEQSINEGRGQNQEQSINQGRGQNQEQSNNQGRGQNQAQSNSQVRGQNQEQSINQGSGQNQEQSINQGRGQNQGQSNNQGRGQNQVQDQDKKQNPKTSESKPPPPASSTLTGKRRIATKNRSEFDKNFAPGSVTGGDVEPFTEDGDLSDEYINSLTKLKEQLMKIKSSFTGTLDWRGTFGKDSLETLEHFLRRLAMMWLKNSSPFSRLLRTPQEMTPHDFEHIPIGLFAALKEQKLEEKLPMLPEKSAVQLCEELKTSTLSSHNLRKVLKYLKCESLIELSEKLREAVAKNAMEEMQDTDLTAEKCEELMKSSMLTAYPMITIKKMCPPRTLLDNLDEVPNDDKKVKQIMMLIFSGRDDTQIVQNRNDILRMKGKLHLLTQKMLRKIQSNLILDTLEDFALEAHKMTFAAKAMIRKHALKDVNLGGSTGINALPFLPCEKKTFKRLKLTADVWKEYRVKIEKFHLEMKCKTLIAKFLNKFDNPKNINWKEDKALISEAPSRVFREMPINVQEMMEDDSLKDIPKLNEASRRELAKRVCKGMPGPIGNLKKKDIKKLGKTVVSSLPQDNMAEFDIGELSDAILEMAEEASDFFDDMDDRTAEAMSKMILRSKGLRDTVDKLGNLLKAVTVVDLQGLEHGCGDLGSLTGDTKRNLVLSKRNRPYFYRCVKDAIGSFDRTNSNFTSERLENLKELIRGLSRSELTNVPPTRMIRVFFERSLTETQAAVLTVKVKYLMGFFQTEEKDTIETEELNDYAPALKRLRKDDLMDLDVKKRRDILQAIGDTSLTDVPRKRLKMYAEIFLDAMGKPNGLITADDVEELNNLLCWIPLERIGDIEQGALTDGEIFNNCELMSKKRRKRFKDVLVTELNIDFNDTTDAASIAPLDTLILDIEPDEMEQLPDETVAEVAGTVMKKLEKRRQTRKDNEVKGIETMTVDEQQEDNEAESVWVKRVVKSTINVAQSDSRKKRSTTSLTCDDMLSLGSGVTGMTTNQIEAITDSDFLDCASTLGRFSSWTPEQITSLLNVASRTGTYKSSTQWSADNVYDMGKIVQGLTAGQLSSLPQLTTDAMFSIGRHDGWREDQLIAGFARWLELNTGGLASRITSSELLSLGHFACGATTDHIENITSTVYSHAANYIGELTSCQEDQLESFANLAKEAFGDLETWDDGVIATVGNIIGGLSAQDIGSLTTDQIAVIEPISIAQIPPSAFVGFTADQLLFFSSTQSGSTTKNQQAGLTQEQLAALADSGGIIISFSSAPDIKIPAVLMMSTGLLAYLFQL